MDVPPGSSSTSTSRCISRPSNSSSTSSISSYLVFSTTATAAAVASSASSLIPFTLLLLLLLPPLPLLPPLLPPLLLLLLLLSLVLLEAVVPLVVVGRAGRERWAGRNMSAMARRGMGMPAVSSRARTTEACSKTAPLATNSLEKEAISFEQARARVDKSSYISTAVPH